MNRLISQTISDWRRELLLDVQPDYRLWRRRFIRNRLVVALALAVGIYITFTLLRFIATPESIAETPYWLPMALVIQALLLLYLWLLYLPWGRRHPGRIFLAASLTVTLIEQVWATLNGFAHPGLRSWTLVFLVQATLIPLRWPLHLLSQLVVLAYYYGVNMLLGLPLANDTLEWNLRQTLYIFWFCGVSTLSVYFYERLQWNQFTTRQALNAEKNRSEHLLLNILPQAIAEKLKRDNGTIADSFAEATVLFADIVGFTQMASNMPPREVVELLNQIFSLFDQLADKHQLEKIKTIGDAYMVVGGIPDASARHVEAIADMALDMQRAIVRLSRAQGRPLSIRIGINTGPVIAGVIGRKRFVYDLWGDAVNIASRMESQGEPGGIQVTEAVWLRLREHYRLEERGLIHVKGKGDMRTYWLKGRPNLNSRVEAPPEVPEAPPEAQLRLPVPPPVPPAS
ncbi:MAG: adenylate/guanylate cyclase domain-containing protein [Elainellaceae cyanobacterium]